MDDDLSVILRIGFGITIFFLMMMGFMAYSDSANNDVECTKIKEMNLPYKSFGKNILKHETCKVIMKNGGLISYKDLSNFNVVEI